MKHIQKSHRGHFFGLAWEYCQSLDCPDTGHPAGHFDTNTEPGWRLMEQRDLLNHRPHDRRHRPGWWHGACLHREGLLHSGPVWPKVLSALRAQCGDLPGHLLPRWNSDLHLPHQVPGTVPDTPTWASALFFLEEPGVNQPVLVRSLGPGREARGPGPGGLGSSGCWGP